MASLVNEETATLLQHIKDAIEKTTANDEERTFVAFTCYIDRDAIDELISAVQSSIIKQGGHLARVLLFVDAGEWAKQRIDRNELKRLVRDRTGLIKRVTIAPAWFGGKLFHAKCYALIGPRDDSNRRKGFVVLTSGNLTKRGLGLVRNHNVEFLHVSQDADLLEEVSCIAKSLENERRPPKEYDQRHADLMVALELFGSGVFYHKWTSTLSSVGRFTLTLTEAGRNASIRSDNPFSDYESKRETVSREPIQLNQVFENVGRVFPRMFWAYYSVDTLLGRWVPQSVAAVIDERLVSDVCKYVDEIKRIANDKQLADTKRILCDEVSGYFREGYIEETENVVDRWHDRVRQFRDDKEAVKLNIINYEKVPDVLDSANRSLVLKMFKGVRDRVSVVRNPKGLKLTIASYLEGQNVNLDDAFSDLAGRAREELMHQGRG
ncbi:hypothetical protein [Thiocapsa roseopersicina]|uniref:Phospholipase D-like domain-containing protein n=1 Tax=Thiocapsa roseopersicina TaxID=1058 RepID=A0A1H3BTU3_THIRO|nr:hypothetical protein [Thiocapsa roseopersicina]SDX45420.1 hypothetical protein SAMN05421783_12719 [Thiocapsa roseopersicina]